MAPYHATTPLGVSAGLVSWVCVRVPLRSPSPTVCALIASFVPHSYRLHAAVAGTSRAAWPVSLISAASASDRSRDASRFVRTHARSHARTHA
eukprot:5922846-Pleurochrysis_carterae.AAC.1